jgi:hypothetical protein
VNTGSGRDAAPNSCGCASSLTLVGSYCRNLSADDAFALTCSGSKIEVKNSDAGTTTWTNRDLCSSSVWRVATGLELKCICNQVGLTGEYFQNDIDYYDDYCHTLGYLTVAILYPDGWHCDGSKPGDVGKCGVLQYMGSLAATALANIRCVR